MENLLPIVEQGVSGCSFLISHLSNGLSDNRIVNQQQKVKVRKWIKLCVRYVSNLAIWSSIDWRIDSWRALRSQTSLKDQNSNQQRLPPRSVRFIQVNKQLLKYPTSTCHRFQLPFQRSIQVHLSSRTYLAASLHSSVSSASTFLPSTSRPRLLPRTLTCERKYRIGVQIQD